jgi:uncharacterized protein YjiS (DUF1127 family)
MTMLSPTQSRSSPPLRRIVLLTAARLRRLMNGWAAALIAHRERQAAIAALRRLDDRELKDMGVYRGDIEDLVAKAAEARLRQIRFF